MDGGELVPDGVEGVFQGTIAVFGGVLIGWEGKAQTTKAATH